MHLLSTVTTGASGPGQISPAGASGHASHGPASLRIDRSNQSTGSFENALQRAGSQASVNSSNPVSGTNILNQLTADWRSANRQTVELQRNFPAQLKPYLETQLLVQRLNLQVQMFSSASQAAVSTVRTLQQSASG